MMDVNLGDLKDHISTGICSIHDQDLVHRRSPVQILSTLDHASDLHLSNLSIVCPFQRSSPVQSTPPLGGGRVDTDMDNAIWES
jgi:hypothetical protein